MGNRSQEVVLSILTIASLLLPAQHIEAAPPNGKEGNTEMTSGGPGSSGAQWKAHPEKGWVRADEIEEQRDLKKENSKRANRKLRGNRATKQN
jgi:hypothetical protein